MRFKMIIELGIAIPLILLYRYNIINLIHIILIVLFVYWIPKFFFISGIEFFFPMVLTRRINSDKQIALTFDDVPCDLSYNDLIQTLDKHNVKATLFIISDYVNDNNIQTLINAVKKGHQLGNHGRTNSAHILLSKSRLIEEIKHCDHLIREIYSKAEISLPKQMIYRPGCGLFSNRMIEEVHRLGYSLAMGSVYPNDPIVRFSWINYYYLINHIESGDIVILHDRLWTSIMLEKLLPYLQKHNYQMVTIDEL